MLLLSMFDGIALLRLSRTTTTSLLSYIIIGFVWYDSTNIYLCSHHVAASYPYCKDMNR